MIQYYKMPKEVSWKGNYTFDGVAMIYIISVHIQWLKDVKR